jgi:rubrerythrin
MNLDSFTAPRGLPFDPTDPLRGRVWRCADCGHMVKSDQPAPAPESCPQCKGLCLEKRHAPLQ